MITILSYCDTQQKKDQLLNLITGLKSKFPEKEILVYSHYQNLEPMYYKGANYYIFDFTNLKKIEITYPYNITQVNNVGNGVQGASQVPSCNNVTFVTGTLN